MQQDAYADPQQDVMFWDAVSLDSWTPLVVISLTQIEQRNVEDILPLIIHGSFPLYILFNAIVDGFTRNLLEWIFKLILYFLGQLEHLISLT